MGKTVVMGDVGQNKWYNDLPVNISRVAYSPFPGFVTPGKR